MEYKDKKLLRLKDSRVIDRLVNLLNYENKENLTLMVDSFIAYENDNAKGRRLMKKLLTDTKTRSASFHRYQMIEAYKAITEDCWTYSYVCLPGYDDCNGCYKRTGTYDSITHLPGSTIRCECGQVGRFMLSNSIKCNTYVSQYVIPYIN
jgi:hypothetical protein